MILIKVLFLLLFIYLAVSILYLLVIACAGKFGRKRRLPKAVSYRKIAVIIPSYKEDMIIVDTAARALGHDYPADRFSVLVAADKLQPETIARLRALPVEVLELDVNMKSRSINAAMAALDGRGFDIALILDADNVMGDGCLHKINNAFEQGYQAVQCHRTAKNQHTPVALLDAISESININLFRRGPAMLGLSPAPIGSGMAFNFGLLRDIFNVEHILTNPGEDREIDMQLMRRNVFMYFMDDAYVYDEKVASAGVFEKQRVRWLEAQVNHVRRFFDADMQDAPKNTTYFLKFFQNLLLPRLLLIMLLGLLTILLILQYLFSFTIMMPHPIAWISLMLCYALVLVLSVPGRFYSVATLRAVLHVPVLMIAMVKALLKVKAGRKEFLHTPKVFKP